MEDVHLCMYVYVPMWISGWGGGGGRVAVLWFLPHSCGQLMIVM